MTANEKLHHMIKDIQFTMITTQNKQGELCSCPMTTQNAPFDEDLWFLVGKNSAMCKAIEMNPMVNLSYAEPKDTRYLSISGHAEILSDRKKARELWSPVYHEWFPQGLEDPNLAVLKVNVHRAEFWDTPNGKLMQLVGFMKALATGKPYEATKAKHDTIQLH